MRKGTSPILLRIARLFQSIPPFFFTWIEIFFKKNYIKTYPLIILVSPPRSGSTLSYQLLSRGTRSLYFTNIWNLFYSLPIIGGLISKNNRDNRSNFTSDRGLVGGIYGEAEGLKFWRYWTSQGLEESNKTLPLRRIKYLRKVFGRLLSKDYPMVTAYLGHSFSINKLRKIFPGCMFIYLKRDKLSNIYSMLQTYKEFEQERRNFNWMSLKPLGWKNKINEPILNKVIWQYNEIVKRIENDILDNDTLIVQYEEICENPKGFLQDVKSFAMRKNIDITLTLDNIPESFNVSQIKENENLDTKKISDLIKDE